MKRKVIIHNYLPARRRTRDAQFTQWVQVTAKQFASLEVGKRYKLGSQSGTVLEKSLGGLKVRFQFGSDKSTYRVSTEGGDTYTIEAKSLEEAQRQARQDHPGERVTVYEDKRGRDAEPKSTHADFLRAKANGTVYYGTGMNEGWYVNLMGKQGGPFKTLREAEEFYHKHHFVRSSKDADDLQRYAGDVIWTTVSEAEFNRIHSGDAIQVEGIAATVIDKEKVESKIGRPPQYRVRVRFKSKGGADSGGAFLSGSARRVGNHLEHPSTVSRDEEERHRDEAYRRTGITRVR